MRMFKEVETMLADRIKISDTDWVALCRKYQIHKLALFGSILREDFNPESDVDVLVEFEAEAKIGFFELIEIEMESSDSWLL